MAEAFKCDICGKYFDRAEKDSQVWKVILSIDASVRPARSDDYEPRDLCPKCYAKLEKMMYPAFVARFGKEEE